MAIAITDKQMIERQIAMKGCGVSVDMIRRAMGWTDAQLAKAISEGKTALAAASGTRAEGIEKAVKALKIEAELRGMSI